MNSAAVAEIVAKELATYRYEPPSIGTTEGTPWSEANVHEHLIRLRASLVEPYLRTFILKDTLDQINAVSAVTAEYWVVFDLGYIEFYDSEAKEFGLAAPGHNGENPVTIGVRGDLVGVFCAM